MFMNECSNSIITIKNPLLPFLYILLPSTTFISEDTTLANFSVNHFITPGSETPVINKHNKAPSESCLYSSFHHVGLSSGSSLRNVDNFWTTSVLAFSTSCHSSVIDVQVDFRYASNAFIVDEDDVNCRSVLPWDWRE